MAPRETLMNQRFWVAPEALIFSFLENRTFMQNWMERMGALVDILTRALFV